MSVSFSILLVDIKIRKIKCHDIKSILYKLTKVIFKN